jgi:hypothetical protein
LIDLKLLVEDSIGYSLEREQCNKRLHASIDVEGVARPFSKKERNYTNQKNDELA